MLRTGIALLLAVLFVHCAHAPRVAQAPSPQPTPQQAPQLPPAGGGCPETTPGNGCLTLRFMVADSVRDDAKRPIRGDLYWGLYRSSDVGALGPRSHKPVLSGEVPAVDLNGPGTSTDVNLPDVTARKYKAMAYIDVQDTHAGTPVPGDPVTLPPHRPIEVSPGSHVEAPVIFNFVR